MISACISAKADLDLHPTMRLLRDGILMGTKRLNVLICCWTL
jgi:hypothetical protein